MAIERFIDYMQFSAYFQESAAITAGYDRVAAVRFYKRGYRDKMGIRYYFEPVRGKKCLVIAAGEAMENLRSLRNDYEILNWAIEAGAKFSRIDLAVTEWNTMQGLFMVDDAVSWYKKGLIESPLVERGAKLVTAINIEIENTPETLYIGSLENRAKRGICRVYDKGVQLKLGEYMATRIELELKREKAHAAALRIAQSNDIAGNFRAYFNVRHKEFERIMDADAVSTRRGKAKEKIEERDELAKRWDWLINQVAPALGQAIKKDRELGYGSARLGKFLNASGLGDEMLKEVEEREKFFKEQTFIKFDPNSD